MLVLIVVLGVVVFGFVCFSGLLGGGFCCGCLGLGLWLNCFMFGDFAFG